MAGPQVGRGWTPTDHVHTAQVVADRDRCRRCSPSTCWTDPSFANSVLADVQVELSRIFDLKFSYRFYDVATTYDDVLLKARSPPGIAALIDLAYASRDDAWRFDVALNLFGGAHPGYRHEPGGPPLPRAFPGLWHPACPADPHGRRLGVLPRWREPDRHAATAAIVAPDDPFGPYFLMPPDLGSDQPGHGIRRPSFHLNKTKNDAP